MTDRLSVYIQTERPTDRQDTDTYRTIANRESVASLRLKCQEKNHHTRALSGSQTSGAAYTVYDADAGPHLRAAAAPSQHARSRRGVLELKLYHYIILLYCIIYYIILYYIILYYIILYYIILLL